MNTTEQYKALSNGSAGVWLGTDQSQAVCQGDFSVFEHADAWTPKPSHWFVKVGWDSGSLWGPESVLVSLREQYGERIIPYLFPLPGYDDAFGTLVGQLHRIGFHFVCLNVEEIWNNEWNQLDTLLAKCGADTSPTLIAGYAWFLWASNPLGLAQVLAKYPCTYLGESYFGQLTTNPETGKKFTDKTKVDWVREQLDSVTSAAHNFVGDVEVSIILDSASLSTPEYVDYATGGNGLSVWYDGDLTEDEWTALFQRYNPSVFDVVLDPLDEANATVDRLIEENGSYVAANAKLNDAIAIAQTNLGQAIAWATDLLMRTDLSDDARNLGIALQTAIETADTTLD